MNVTETHATIDALLETWRPALGADFDGYRNHVYRVFHIAARLARAEGDAVEKLAVAAAFHDIGIWLDRTFDYLEPSSRRAADYLASTGRGDWTDEVHRMIDQHHRVRPWRGPEPNLVEAFRRADWLDVCLFALPTRLERAYLADLLRRFPRRGFHRRLVALTMGWWRGHPLDPLPVLKW